MELRFKNKNGWHVYGWMIHNLDLNGTERDIYAIIFGFSQDEDSMFYGGLKYLEQGLKISKNTAINMLKKLVEKDLLIKITEIKNSVTFNYYKVNPKFSGEIDSLAFLGKNVTDSESNDNDSGGGGENFAPPYQNEESLDFGTVVQNLGGGGANFAPRGANFGHTKDNIQYNSNLKKERGQKEKFLPPTLNEVILFFQKGNIKASAENFFNHWESVGWKKSRGQQIFNWEALVPKWVENEIQFTPAPAQSKTGANPSPKMKQQREILFENFKKKTRAFVEQLQTDASALETARIKFNQECNTPFEFSSQAVYTEINAYQIWITNAPQLISEVDLTELTFNQFKRNFFNWFKIQNHGSYLFSETPNKAHRPPALQKI